MKLVKPIGKRIATDFAKSNGDIVVEGESFEIADSEKDLIKVLLGSGFERAAIQVASQSVNVSVESIEPAKKKVKE